MPGNARERQGMPGRTTEQGAKNYEPTKLERFQCLFGMRSFGMRFGAQSLLYNPSIYHNYSVFHTEYGGLGMVASRFSHIVGIIQGQLR